MAESRASSRMYFSVAVDTDKLQLDKIAESLGYIRAKGQGAGSGDFGRVIDAIYTGECIVTTTNDIDTFASSEYFRGIDVGQFSNREAFASMTLWERIKLAFTLVWPAYATEYTYIENEQGEEE